MPLIRQTLEQGRSVRFSPRGTSMLPLIRQDRDSVLLSPAPAELKKYDIALYRRGNGQYVLHRIVKAGPVCTCMGDNQFVPEPGIRREQIIAVVSAISRDGSELEANCLRLRIYSRLWHITRLPRRLIRGLRVRLRRILT